MTTGEYQRGGDSLPGLLAADQAAARLSASSEPPVTFAAEAALARRQDMPQMASPPSPRYLAEFPWHLRRLTRTDTSRWLRLAVLVIVITACAGVGAALQRRLQNDDGNGIAAFGVQLVVMVQLLFAADRGFTSLSRESRLATAFAGWNTLGAVVGAVSLGGYAAAVSHWHVSLPFADVVMTAAFATVQYTFGHAWSLATARRQRHAPMPPWWKRLSLLTREPWPLVGVLAVQAGLSLRLVWSNTAFGDEALYLWSGHVEWAHWLHGTPVPNFAAYFSGVPAVYPPIGAVADSIGGLAAARILSLFFMLISTGLLYLTARALLFDKRAAFYAAAAFALLGPTLSLAFATHDAMALMLVALSSWLAVRASRRHPEPFLLLAGAAMALANAAKYASALWDPAVVAIAIAASWHAGPCIRVLRGIRVATYAGCALGVAFFRFGGPAYEHGVLVTTVARPGGMTPAATVLRDGFDYISPIVILSVLAVIATHRASMRIRFLCISVTIACLLALVNQARIHTLTSLHKHDDFGAWFAAIAVGYVISQASRLQHERSWRVAVAIAVLVPLTALSLSVSSGLYRWAPAAGLVAKLEPLIRNPRARYLMDPQSASIVYYYLHAEVYPGELGLVQCTWWDPLRHKELHGPPACTAAIKAHYYELIETDDAANGPRGTPAEVAVWNAIRASGAYRLIYRAHQLYHHEDLFQIWQLRNPRGVRHVAGAQR